MAYVENGMIQAPVYIYRVRSADERQWAENLEKMQDFLVRRINDDGYVPECFYFEADYLDDYKRLIARPIRFDCFWATGRDEEEDEDD